MLFNIYLKISYSFATAGTDYIATPSPTNLSLENGLSLRVCSTVQVLDDVNVEGKETFKVLYRPVISNANFIFIQDSATVSIVDDGESAALLYCINIVKKLLGHIYIAINSL